MIIKMAGISCLDALEGGIAAWMFEVDAAVALIK